MVKSNPKLNTEHRQSNKAKEMNVYLVFFSFSTMGSKGVLPWAGIFHKRCEQLSHIGQEQPQPQSPPFTCRQPAAAASKLHRHLQLPPAWFGYKIIIMSAN